MHRTALRALVVALAAAALALPSSTAVAADDEPDAIRGLTASQAADLGLVDAIATAREDFRTSAIAARTTLKATLDGIRADILADAARVRAGTTTYREALARARAARQGQVDTAVAAARSQLITARTLYAAAVAAAFAREVPGDTPARPLLDPTWWPGISDSTWLTGER